MLMLFEVFKKNFCESISKEMMISHSDGNHKPVAFAWLQAFFVYRSLLAYLSVILHCLTVT